MSYIFYFSRYQTKCVIKFLFRQSSSKAVTEEEGDWGDGRKSEIQKFEYLENEKNFLDEVWNKKPFS